MDIELPPYYHGTSQRSAEELESNGIDFRRTQSRDRGFFGDGFYVTANIDVAEHHASTMGSDGGAIVKLELNLTSNELFYAGETFAPGTIRPTSPPSWHDEFIDWSLQSVEDAAVWEYATDRSKTDIMGSAEESRTPGSESFERKKWYQEVTKFASEQGYDIVYWTADEIVIQNNSIVSEISILD
jgi:hypothetical protein